MNSSTEKAYRASYKDHYLGENEEPGKKHHKNRGKERGRGRGRKERGARKDHKPRDSHDASESDNVKHDDDELTAALTPSGGEKGPSLATAALLTPSRAAAGADLTLGRGVPGPA